MATNRPTRLLHILPKDSENQEIRCFVNFMNSAPNRLSERVVPPLKLRNCDPFYLVAPTHRGDPPEHLRSPQPNDHFNAMRIEPPERPPGRMEPPPEACLLMRCEPERGPPGDPPDDPPGHTSCLSPTGCSPSISAVFNLSTTSMP